MIHLATKFRPSPDSYALAARAGFRNAELWTDAEVLAGWRQVAEMGRQSGMLRHAVHFPNRLDQPPEVLEQAVGLSRALGCSAVVIHQPHIDRHGAALLRLAPDLPLAVENHKLTPEGLRAWAETNPGLALDIEHLWKLTLGPATPLAAVLEALGQFLSEFGHKLLHVHLPGYLPGQPEHRPMYCSRDLALGAFTLLAEARFGGLVVSEVLEEFQNLQDLQMDVLLHRRWQALRGTDGPPAAAP